MMKICIFSLFLMCLLVSLTDGKSALQSCQPCEIMDCLYGIHPDAEKPGICNCTCKSCSNTCKNCQYGVLSLNSDGCPNCDKCCSNPCNKNPCRKESVCIPNKYPSPFKLICAVDFTCHDKNHEPFNCKNLKCGTNEKCIEGNPETNNPAKCGK